MLKKRWTKALLLIFLVWLMISIYFYFQHRVAVTIINVPGWEIDVSNTMQIKQIRIYDWEWDYSYFKKPDKWQYIVGFGNVIPNEKLRSKYFSVANKILHFYNAPYKKLDDSNRIDVSGVLINSEHFFRENWPEIQISVNQMPVYLGSFETQHSSNSNITFFTGKGFIRNDLYHAMESIELKYNVKSDLENSDLHTKSIKVSKDDKRNYGFFNRVPLEYSFFDLRVFVNEFITKLPDEKQQARQIISNKIVDFPWDNIPLRVGQKDELIVHCTAENYLGDYKNFNNVFVVDVAYKFRDEENYDQQVRNDKADVTQNFYIIAEDDQWKIIDVSPLNTFSVNGI